MIKHLRPNDKRFKNALVCLYVMIVLEVMMLLSETLQYILLNDIVQGNFVSDSSIDQNDLRQIIIAIVYGIAYLITAVYFIMWFRRAYFNIGQRINTEYSEGWAAGGWFVPFISLYYPYKIMKELYVKTNAILRDKSNNHTHKVSVTSVGIWWGLWISTNITGQILFRWDPETAETYVTYSAFSMFSNVLGIALAFLAIKVLKDYRELEIKFHEIDTLSLSGTNSAEKSELFLPS